MILKFCDMLVLECYLDIFKNLAREGLISLEKSLLYFTSPACYMYENMSFRKPSQLRGRLCANDC